MTEKKVKDMKEGDWVVYPTLDIMASVRLRLFQLTEIIDVDTFLFEGPYGRFITNGEEVFRTGTEEELLLYQKEENAKITNEVVNLLVNIEKRYRL